MCLRILAFFIFSFVFSNLSGRETLLKFGSNWYYQNGEVPLEPNWSDIDFDQKKWKNGTAPFVYGQYLGNTIIKHSSSTRPITTYYRTSFHIDDPTELEFLQLSSRIDDGFALYINGRLALTGSLPRTRPITPDVLSIVFKDKYSPPETVTLPSHYLSLFKEGMNSLAVEIHQYSADSDDMMFDLELSGTKKGTKEKTIVERGSEWSFYDRRRRPEGEWTELEYDDSSWKSGDGGFGYENESIKTKVDGGDDPNNRPITTWFRRKFEVDEKNIIDSIALEFLLDDGAVVFLNGHEVYRHNMSAGFVDHYSPAMRTVDGAFENHWLKHDLPGHFLKQGENVIAVSVHQVDARSDDLAFDLSLGIEFREGQRDGEAVEVIATSKTVDITDKQELQKGDAGDWLKTSSHFMEEAVKYHQVNKLSPAVRAFYASKWAEVFSKYGDLLGASLKDYLLAASQVSVSQEFFDLYAPGDNHQRVYEIIEELFLQDEGSFRAFPKLAMAIAIVYDQEPPTDWPHHQVSGHILKRKLPDPGEAMKFWVETDRSGKSLQDLKDMSIEELKFVVDTPASFEELKEAQDLRVRLTSIDSLYSGIEYSHERLETNTFNWPHETYVLPRIKKEGGICVDQAYYTVQVAKAHGVPSMMVSGPGNNGNHAWVGFLDNRGRWDFTVGRYEESKYVTGNTFDPQTWEQPTDHQLAMMSERFRTNPKFRISRVHTVFSQEYLRRKKFAEAVEAAEEAIESEKRNYSAWEALIAAKRAMDSPIAEMDEIFQEGAKAFSRYADLEAIFMRNLCNSFEKQGRIAEAEKIRGRIISRNRRERPDLALEESKSALEDSMIIDELEEQVDIYKKQISRLKDAGLIAYYALTNPFLEHLLSKDRKDLAKTALEYTERRMDVEEGSQLESALVEWQGRVED